MSELLAVLLKFHQSNQHAPKDAATPATRHEQSYILVVLGRASPHTIPSPHKCTFTPPLTLLEGAPPLLLMSPRALRRVTIPWVLLCPPVEFRLLLSAGYE